MDAVKILLPYFLLMAAHIWAKRWTWCFTWTAIMLVVVCAEVVAALNPVVWLAAAIIGAFGVAISILLFFVWKFNNERTISQDIWALFDKRKPEYSPIKGFTCVGSWLLFAFYLAAHFVFRV